jgi:hypothetical protein
MSIGLQRTSAPARPKCHSNWQDLPKVLGCCWVNSPAIRLWKSCRRSGSYRLEFFESYRRALFVRRTARAIGVAKLTLAFAIRIARHFLNSLPFRLRSLCSYSFTKLSIATRPGSVLTARISLPLRTITRFSCALAVVRVPVQSEFTV